MQTTVGQLLINDALPEELRDHDRVMDKKGINTLLREIAQKHPEKYREVSHRLSQIGWRASQESGGYSFGLDHMRTSKYARAMRRRLRKAINQVLEDDTLDPKAREKKMIQLVGKESAAQQAAIYDEAMAANNPLAFQVLSGSRGNKMNLSSLLGSDMLYSDHRDEVIPVPVIRSYSEGLSPAEYWAGTYGARKGVMATKFATQEAGFLSKQLNQVAHRLVVRDLDGDGDPDVIRGMPVDTDDPDNEGALLARDAGDYKRNTVLTPKILKELKRQGNKRILIRSPIVGGSPDGGVYARDVGVRETGSLPGRGEIVGLAAAQALSEPLSQAQLSAKHSGGVAGEEKSLSGFDHINAMIQVPKKLKGGAAHAEVDGKVSHIREAPAGGFYVSINGEEHYVAEGFGLKVKKGDKVEAGDVISDGIPNPAKVVQHKGVGEGRRYFINAFQSAMRSAGLKSHRRNVELLSRGLINHVRLSGEMGDYVPEDIVPYSTLEHIYKPREDAEDVSPSVAVGRYLERPVMHYSIGTKIRPSMLKDMKQFGIESVTAHKEPPPFEPEMVRGMYSLQHDPDWMTRMYGSGLKGSVIKGVHRGATSNARGTSFVPDLAQAVDFGRQGAIKPPEPFQKQAQAGRNNFRAGVGKVTPNTPSSAKPATPQPVQNNNSSNTGSPVATPPPQQPSTGEAGAVARTGVSRVPFGNRQKQSPTAVNQPQSNNSWLHRWAQNATNKLHAQNAHTRFNQAYPQNQNMPQMTNWLANSQQGQYMRQAMMPLFAQYGNQMGALAPFMGMFLSDPQSFNTIFGNRQPQYQPQGPPLPPGYGQQPNAAAGSPQAAAGGSQAAAAGQQAAVPQAAGPAKPYNESDSLMSGLVGATTYIPQAQRYANAVRSGTVAKMAPSLNSMRQSIGNAANLARSGNVARGLGAATRIGGKVFAPAMTVIDAAGEGYQSINRGYEMGAKNPLSALGLGFDARVEDTLRDNENKSYLRSVWDNMGKPTQMFYAAPKAYVQTGQALGKSQIGNYFTNKNMDRTVDDMEARDQQLLAQEAAKAKQTGKATPYNWRQHYQRVAVNDPNQNWFNAQLGGRKKVYRYKDRETGKVMELNQLPSKARKSIYE